MGDVQDYTGISHHARRMMWMLSFMSRQHINDTKSMVLTTEL